MNLTKKNKYQKMNFITNSHQLCHKYMNMIIINYRIICRKYIRLINKGKMN